MEREIFGSALKEVQTGLRGKFDASFIEFLWKSVCRHPDDAWQECCRRISVGTKRIEELVAGDFLAVLRDLASEKSHRQAVWHYRSEPIVKPDLEKVARKIEADPAMPDSAKRFAESLAHEKHPLPVQGGERYRRPN
jgi:hypothetical protein